MKIKEVTLKEVPVYKDPGSNKMEPSQTTGLGGRGIVNEMGQSLDSNHHFDINPHC